MKKKSIIASIVCLLLFIGCASINLDTEEKKFLSARAELNLLLEQYILIQDSIPDPDHEKAKLAFTTADEVLDAWESKLSVQGYDWTQDIKLWLDAKNIIIKILMEVNK